MPLLVGLIALLIVVPTAEIAVILTIGSQIGPWWTILLLVASAVLGSWLLRREGRRAYRALREALGAGRTPAAEAAEGAVVLLAGLLMILPGFLTDVSGLLLVLPPVRRAVGRLVIRQFARRLPPEVAARVFGPMRVRSRRARIRQGRGRASGTTPSGPSGAGPASPTAPGTRVPPRRSGPAPVIEGEIDG